MAVLLWTFSSWIQFPGRLLNGAYNSLSTPFVLLLACRLRSCFPLATIFTGKSICLKSFSSACNAFTATQTLYMSLYMYAKPVGTLVVITSVFAASSCRADSNFDKAFYLRHCQC